MTTRLPVFVHIGVSGSPTNGIATWVSSIGFTSSRARVDIGVSLPPPGNLDNRTRLTCRYDDLKIVIINVVYKQKK